MWSLHVNFSIYKLYITKTKRKKERKHFSFYNIINLHSTYLIKHPLEAHSCGALIFGSTSEPIKIVHCIHCLQNWGNILPSFAHREYLTIGAYINMTVQKCLKPSTSRSLHWQDGKKPNRITSTLLSAHPSIIN